MEEQCVEPGSEGTAFIDKMQRGVYLSVCGTALWFDGLFGTRRFDQDSDATFGRIGLYELWDDRDGFDTRLRLRARLALPDDGGAPAAVLRPRGREGGRRGHPARSRAAPCRAVSSEVEDDAWLLGLGYSKQNGLTNGFDFGVGIRISTPVDPYTKGSYRRTFIFSDATALRARQTRVLARQPRIRRDHRIRSRSPADAEADVALG